jgi:hypothetical protein
VNRRWLALDEVDVLDVMLALHVPAGKPLSLPPNELVEIEQTLRQPAGFAS